ncbi:MAG TPA: hypothetical protein GYA08_21785 [Chloroflexi bacterium]|nr:hypothetical protein [Chloroflexota bacterium]
MKTITNALSQWAGWLAMGGGLLWILYTILALLQPLGSMTPFIGAQGELAVTNPLAFRATGVVGGAALILLGLAVVGAAARYHLPGRQPHHFNAVVPSRFGVAMGWVGALAGVLAATTALLLLVLPTSAMHFFGAVLVPLGAMLVAIEANGSDHAYPIATPLFLVGALGMIGLLVQALLPVVAWMLPVYAALIMAVYGFAWVRFGNLLMQPT